MTKRKTFTSAKALDNLIIQYFDYIKGEYQEVQKKSKGTDQKTKIIEEKNCLRAPEPATLTGLALHLSFNSLKEFEDLRGKKKICRPA